MSNGLLQGLVECWQPDVALGSLKGMVAGIDYSTNIALSVVSEAGFPSGKAIRVAVDDHAIIFTDANPLLEDFGSQDFLAMFWVKLTAIDGLGLFAIGENVSNGFDVANNGNAVWPDDVGFAIPNEGNNYPRASTNDGPITSGNPHCILCWWTVADLTLHLQVDGGAEFTAVSLLPAGPPDPTNVAVTRLGYSTLSETLTGDEAVWKGTIPDSTQRSLLFGGLPFSQWDSGGAAIPQRAASGQYAIRTH